MTKQELALVFNKLLSVFGNAKFNNLQETLETYYFVLGKYDKESIEKAAMLCIEECTFFPKPAEIIGRIQKANMLYTPVPKPQIEASADSYMEEQIDWYLSEFQEGGSLGYDVEPEFTKGQGVLGTGLLDVTDPRKLGLNAYKPLSDWANIIGDKKGID